MPPPLRPGAEDAVSDIGGVPVSYLAGVRYPTPYLLSRVASETEGMPAPLGFEARPSLFGPAQVVEQFQLELGSHMSGYD